ncbi:MAG: putative entry exclusion protein TrbK-alt [Verrucomicrobiaceae bacterium]
MDMKMLARAGALAFVLVAILATAIEFGREEDASPPIPHVPGAAADPLRGELVRCQLLGEAGTSDTACLRAWAENRRRFMAPGARAMERLPEAAPTSVEDVVRKQAPPAGVIPESE